MSADRRRAVRGHEFVAHPPLTLRSPLRIQIRIQTATARNREFFPEAAGKGRAGDTGAPLRLARSPRQLPAEVLLYAASSVLAKMAAPWKNRTGRTST